MPLRNWLVTLDSNYLPTFHKHISPRGHCRLLQEHALSVLTWELPATERHEAHVDQYSGSAGDGAQLMVHQLMVLAADATNDQPITKEHNASQSWLISWLMMNHQPITIS